MDQPAGGWPDGALRCRPDGPWGWPPLETWPISRRVPGGTFWAERGGLSVRGLRRTAGGAGDRPGRPPLTPVGEPGPRGWPRPPGLAVPPGWASGRPGAGGGRGAPGRCAGPRGCRARAHTRARGEGAHARPRGPSACGPRLRDPAPRLRAGRAGEARGGRGPGRGAGERRGGAGPGGTGREAVPGRSEPFDSSGGAGRAEQRAVRRGGRSRPGLAERSAAEGRGEHPAAPRVAPGAPHPHPAPRTMLPPRLCWLPLLAGLLPPAPAQRFSALTVSPAAPSAAQGTPGRRAPPRRGPPRRRRPRRLAAGQVGPGLALGARAGAARPPSSGGSGVPPASPGPLRAQDLLLRADPGVPPSGDPFAPRTCSCGRLPGSPLAGRRDSGCAPRSRAGRAPPRTRRP